MTRWLTAAVMVVAAFALAPAAANAALSVALVGGDALEDRAMTFIFTGSTSATNEIYATFRVSGGVPCAPSFRADSGSGIVFGEPSGTQEILTRDDPGAYVLCAYLAASSSDPPIEAFTLPVTVRPNTATLAIQAPVAGNPGVAVPVTLAGTTELGRELYAKSKPVGSGPCAQSRSADPSSDSFAFFESALGAFAVPRLAGPFASVGQYTLCAWLQESSTDVVAEAAASAVVTIVPPIPVLTSLEVSPSAFAAQPSGGFTTGSVFSSATTISYRLDNTAAGVRLTVAARRSGRRVGASCRRATRANRNRATCVRYELVPGSYTDDGEEGTNFVRFSGRVGGRRLRTGSYRLFASPRTTTGPGTTLRRAFRVIRSR